MRSETAVAILLSFVVGGATGIVASKIDGSPMTYEQWAVENHFAYYDPITQEFVSDKYQVEEFWMKHDNSAPPEPVVNNLFEQEDLKKEALEKEEGWTDWEPAFMRRNENQKNWINLKMRSEIEDELQQQGFYGIVPGIDPIPEPIAEDDNAVLP